MTEHRCHHAGRTRPRMLRTHLDGCETPRCDGCQPCPERHCQVCGPAHVTVDGRGDDETCTRCLHETRDNIAEIWRLSTRTLGEAIKRGINSQATMLAGAAANPETWGYRRMSALAGRIDSAWLDDCRDEQHPLWVLGTWEQLAREHLDQVADPDHTLTLTAARDYLDGHLTRLAHDGGFAFDELAQAAADCRAHLEDVLGEGDRPETGAPCPACGRSNLVKSYGKDEDADRWTCPRCHQWWTEDDYRAKVDGVYVGVADALTDLDMQKRTRVPAATVRSWAQRGKVRRRGRSHDGRQLYDVSDVEKHRAG